MADVFQFLIAKPEAAYPQFAPENSVGGDIVRDDSSLPGVETSLDFIQFSQLFVQNSVTVHQASARQLENDLRPILPTSESIIPTVLSEGALPVSEPALTEITGVLNLQSGDQPDYVQLLELRHPEELPTITATSPEILQVSVVLSDTTIPTGSTPQAQLIGTAVSNAPETENILTATSEASRESTGDFNITPLVISKQVARSGILPSELDSATSSATTAQENKEIDPAARTTHGDAAATLKNADSIEISEFPQQEPGTGATQPPRSTAPLAVTAVNVSTIAGPDPVRSSPALQQVTNALANIHMQTDRLEIRLDPPDLGRVYIDFNLDGDRIVSATLSADQSDTTSLMRRHTDILLRELSNAGFDDVTLSFSDSAQENTSERENGTLVSSGIVEEVQTAASNSITSERRLSTDDSLDLRL